MCYEHENCFRLLIVAFWSLDLFREPGHGVPGTGEERRSADQRRRRKLAKGTAQGAKTAGKVTASGADVSVKKPRKPAKTSAPRAPRGAKTAGKATTKGIEKAGEKTEDAGKEAGFESAKGAKTAGKAATKGVEKAGEKSEDAGKEAGSETAKAAKSVGKGVSGAGKKVEKSVTGDKN